MITWTTIGRCASVYEYSMNIRCSTVVMDGVELRMR